MATVATLTNTPNKIATLSGRTQGSSVPIQGYSGVIQGSSPNLQPTVDPSRIQNTVNTVPAAANSVASTGTSVVDTSAATAAAAQAAKDAQNLAYLRDQVTGINASGNQSGSVAGSTYNDQGSTLASTLRTGQSGIDSARKNIGVAQINSIRGLADSIQNGLKSGAVSLSNTSALDSSANGAIGRIFANYGNTQRNVINNDAAVKNDAQDTAQTNLDEQRNIGLNSLRTYKNTVLDQISNDMQSKLASIDGIAQTQGLGGKLDINSIKDNVVKNAQQKIADADSYIQGLLGKIGPMSQQEVADKAYALTQAGVTDSTGGLGFSTNGNVSTPAAALGGADQTQIPLSVLRKQIQGV